MKINKFLITLSYFLMAGLWSTYSSAGEVDILVDKLVDKKILTQGEAQQILTETQEEIRTQLAQGKASSVPKWVQDINVKGDFRLRYQWEEKTGSEDRNRARYRFRLGLDSKVNDKLKVGAGLATGGGDPRSTNQTMENTFETPDIRLDYAYAKWMINPYATLEGGKMEEVKKLLFIPSDLLWDSDIHPDGASLVLTNSFDNTELFFNTGFWILDELKQSSKDPFMYIFQPGLKYKFDDNTNLKFGVAYYGFENVKGGILDYSEGTNTLEKGVLKYNYNSLSPSVELGIKEPFGGVIPYLAVFGDYVYNFDPDDNNQGWLTGITFGAQKINKFGDWQVKYMYRQLERDAWLDTFPDSDIYSGGTNIKSHEVILAFGLGKNTELNIDYYNNKRVEGSISQDVLQIDWNLKF